LNPGCCGGKTATDSLSYGAAQTRSKLATCTKQHYSIYEIGTYKQVLQVLVIQGTFQDSKGLGTVGFHATCTIVDVLINI
jgi:hypothetical protein